MEDLERDSGLDGRKRRTARTRANLLDGCRGLMVRGTIRPDSETIAQTARCSIRSVFHHFPTLAVLYAEAVDDIGTAGAVLNHVLGEDWRVAGVPEHLVKRMARAVVMGDGRRYSEIYRAAVQAGR